MWPDWGVDGAVSVAEDQAAGGSKSAEGARVQSAREATGAASGV
jgi:hypothetical protein